MAIEQTDQRLFKVKDLAELSTFMPTPFTGWTYAELETDNTAYRWNSTTLKWEQLVGVSMVPNRRDHSVNGGLCENFAAEFPAPVLRTNTNFNIVGAFNGGGIGNKAMLGHRLSAPLPLSALLSIQVDYERITPEIPPPLVQPYMSLLCVLDPAVFPNVTTIFSLGDPANPLNQGTFTSIGLNKYRTTWNPTANLLLVVLDRGMGVGVPPFVPAVGTPPFPLFGPTTIPFSAGLAPPASWVSRAYSVANILAAYPGALIVNANSGDGGLPKNTETAGVLLVLGDSGFLKQNAVRILAWTLNGVSI